MKKIEHIIDYIVETFEFSIVSPLIPKNEFQISKRNFYLWIKKYNKKLFFFLRKNLPIKYLGERPDQSVWLHKRNSKNRVAFEVEIRKNPEFFIYNKSVNTYKLRIYYNLSDIEQKLFLFDINTGIKLVNKHFSEYKELKYLLRKKKINSI